MTTHELKQELLQGIVDLALPFQPEEVKEVNSEKGCTFFEMNDGSLYQLHVRKLPTGPNED